jgi:hypothetical protein
MINGDCMLTTIDNPYNPFINFDQWYMRDVELGYNTCEYLDRLSPITEDMTQDEINVVVESAMDRIIELDFMNVYVKVYENDKTNTE